MKFHRHLALIAAALCAATLLNAQQSGEYVENAGPYTIHYSMVPVRLLPDEVKRRHSLPESGAVVLNVAVTRGESNIAADVTALADSPVGQVTNIDVRRVDENGMISYLGLVNLLDSQVFHVELTILPEGSLEPIEIEFQESYPAP